MTTATAPLCGKRVCAWCEPPTPLGLLPDTPAGHVEHGICMDCARKHHPATHNLARSLLPSPQLPLPGGAAGQVSTPGTSGMTPQETPDREPAGTGFDSPRVHHIGDSSSEQSSGSVVRVGGGGPPFINGTPCLEYEDESGCNLTPSQQFSTRILIHVAAGLIALAALTLVLVECAGS